MIGRTAITGIALALAGGTTLVVVPSATIEVHGASTSVTTTAAAPISAIGRSFDVGPVFEVATATATGVLPAAQATGVVRFSYQHGFFASLDFGSLAPVICAAGGLGGTLSGHPPACPTLRPAPAPRLFLPVGTRLYDCPWPPPDPNPHPPCDAPRLLVTTAPAAVNLDSSSGPIPVRALSPGEAGNAESPQQLSVAGANRYVDPSGNVELVVELQGDLAGGRALSAPAVSQKDIDSATASMHAQLADALRAAAEREVTTTEQLATPIDSGPPAVTTDHATGDAAQSVTVAGQVSGRATAVNVASLRGLALGAVHDAAAGAHVLVGSVRWDPPVLQPPKPGAEPLVSITVHGLVSALDASAVRYAAALHGAGHVTDVVRRVDPHATVAVSRGFGWSPALVFLDRRVTVVVDGYSAG
jgi:hypothetical protein